MSNPVARQQHAERQAAEVPGWKRRLDDEAQVAERRAQAKPKKVTSKALLSLKPGDQVFYRPRKAGHARFGHRARVVRSPREDVQTPSVRLEFADGQQQTVPVKAVSRVPVAEPTPPVLEDARRRPVWKRIVALLLSADEVDSVNPKEAAAYRHDAEQRVRQLAGTVAPLGSDRAQKTDVARLLEDAVYADARAAASRQPGRDGRGPVVEEVLPDPSRQADAERLDQRGRALINNIARCIHLRYFLSDAEAREEAAVSGVVRRMVELSEREVGTNARPDHSGQGKGNALAGLLHDKLLAMYRSALEACNLRAQGDVAGAEVMERDVQEHRAAFELANAEMERHRKKHHTGRYFHGEILSVREERGERDDKGMMQFYVRLVIVYAEDGHTPTVVNGREIEARTLVEAGPEGWAALGRWIQDLSDREHGRKQGRRQDDTKHLIYRNDGGHLRPRDSVSPELLRAFDAIRRSMLKNDVDPALIPETHPAAGLHLRQSPNTPEQREQRKKALGESMQNVMARALAGQGLT